MAERRDAAVLRRLGAGGSQVAVGRLRQARQLAGPKPLRRKPGPLGRDSRWLKVCSPWEQAREVASVLADTSGL